MHCPSCKELMTNKDECHYVNADSYKMNLHCNNFIYSDGGTCIGKKNSNCYYSHMGVIVCPNQEWICDHYNFSFDRFGRKFILRATPSSLGIKYDGDKFYLLYDDNWKRTEILSDYESSPIIQVPFIPLSTGDDMHLHAKAVFKKLTKLILFS